jgi:hypothetical protein
MRGAPFSWRLPSSAQARISLRSSRTAPAAGPVCRAPPPVTPFAAGRLGGPPVGYADSPPGTGARPNTPGPSRPIGNESLPVLGRRGPASVCGWWPVGRRWAGPVAGSGPAPCSSRRDARRRHGVCGRMITSRVRRTRVSTASRVNARWTLTQPLDAQPSPTSEVGIANRSATAAPGPPRHLLRRGRTHVRPRPSPSPETLPYGAPLPQNSRTHSKGM